jgi:hypothetical protein
MEGLHILQIDGKIIEVVQVDNKGGTKVIQQAPEYTDTLQNWHWEIVKQINNAMQ